MRSLTVQTFKVVGAELPIVRHAVIKAERPDLAAELFEVVETGANEVAVVYLDGRPLIVLGPWQARAYWKVVTNVTVDRVDVGTDPVVAPRHLTLLDRA